MTDADKIRGAFEQSVSKLGRFQDAENSHQEFTYLDMQLLWQAATAQQNEIIEELENTIRYILAANTKLEAEILATDALTIIKKYRGKV